MAAKMDERSAGSRGWTLTDIPHPEDFGDRVLVTVLSTEDLTAEQRCSIAEVCIAAHNNAAFANLFNYIKSGGRHFLAYRGRELASHAVVTTRWVQPEGLTVLKTAFVDAVSTLPAYQGLGYPSAVMRRLAAARFASPIAPRALAIEVAKRPRSLPGSALHRCRAGSPEARRKTLTGAGPMGSCTSAGSAGAGHVGLIPDATALCRLPGNQR